MMNILISAFGAVIAVIIVLRYYSHKEKKLRP